MNFHLLPRIKVNAMALNLEGMPQECSKITQNENPPRTKVHARREQQ